jgi:hypothetical protein
MYCLINLRRPNEFRKRSIGRTIRDTLAGRADHRQTRTAACLPGVRRFGQRGQFCSDTA